MDQQCVQQQYQQQQQLLSLEQKTAQLPAGGPAVGGGTQEPAAMHWSIQPEEVVICRRPDGTYWQLGSGAFGTVYKGLYYGSTPVAVKVLHRVDDARRTVDFQREVTLLKELRDRNVVRFLGACLDGPAAMLVTEYMEFGDLWRALPLANTGGQRIFGWWKRGRRILLDVAHGLQYLHSRRVVHLDLKSANILLSRHGTAKIADIGMARVLNREYLSVLSGLGTFAWSAPELIFGRRCTERVDIYSFGVVLWEVCTGDVPTRGALRPLLPGIDCPPAVCALFDACTAEEPAQRPSSSQLVAALESLQDLEQQDLKGGWGGAVSLPSESSLPAPV